MQVHRIRSVAPRFPVAAVGACVLLATSLIAQPPSSPPERTSLAEERLERTAAFYAEHEELQIPGGSMWKHFVQIERFVKARTIDGALPTAADRMRAWEIAHARRASPVRSDSSWLTIGPPNISGRIVDLKFHPTNPQIVYAAAASGGLWISNDGGHTWRTTTDDLPSIAIGAVCVLPTNPDVVLVATGEGLNWLYIVYGMGIWKSTDAGETWSPTSLNYEITDNHGFHAMEANPITGTILAGSNDGMWRSTDEGDTWIQVLPSVDYQDFKWRPGSATRVYATRAGGTSANGVIVSNDDGLTWSVAGSGQPPSSHVRKTKIAVTDADPNVIYAHYGGDHSLGTLGIYRSIDGGISWTARNTTLDIPQAQGAYAVTLAVDPDDSERVIAGGIRLYLSTDGGVTFAETGAGTPLGDETSVHSDHHASAWEPGSTSNLWVGTDGGVWRSTDNGDNWSPLNEGLVTTQHYDVCIDPGDPDFAMGGSQDNGLPWAEVADDPWYPSTLINDGFACFVEPADPDTIYSEGLKGYHVRSTDRGQSWESTMNGLTGNAAAFAPLDLDPHRPGHLYTSTTQGIFRTTNGQDLWENVHTHRATWISISPVDGRIVWTVSGDTTGPPVRMTRDDADTWSTASSYGFAVGNETKILAHPTSPPTAFVTFAGYSGVAHVARTDDFGATWENVSGDFPPDPANTMSIDPVEPDHWFVGTDTGVWYSTDHGATWLPLGTGLPNVVVYDLEIDQSARKLVAITYGRGAWEFDLQTVGGLGPPGVPSGLSGQPMTAAKLSPDGVDLSVSWDTTTCTDSLDHHLVFGFGSQLPTTPGGIYSLSGRECTIGDVSPFAWNGSPAPSADPSGLVWWLIVATDSATTEGSWGLDSYGTERPGPGPGGSSGECGIVDKSLSNPCGQ